MGSEWEGRPPLSGQRGAFVLGACDCMDISGGSLFVDWMMMGMKRSTRDGIGGIHAGGSLISSHGLRCHFQTIE